MRRPGKPKGQYYLSHQTTDTDFGIITEVTVTPGNVYDSVPYLEQLEHIHRTVIPIQAAAADSAYDFPLAHRVLEEQGITFFVRPQSVHRNKRSRKTFGQKNKKYQCFGGPWIGEIQGPQNLDFFRSCIHSGTT